MHKSICLALLAASLAGCGGGSGSPAAAVNPGTFQISYQSTNGKFYVGVPATSNTPSSISPIDSFTINPTLPLGMTFDPLTGTIAGEPLTTAPARTYAVTAFGPAGTAKADVLIGVVNPPRFAFVANENDSTISSYAIDAETGVMQHRGYSSAPDVAIGPADLLPHPTGEFFFAVNHDSRTISVYAMDAHAGTIEALSTTGQGTSPEEMVLHPNGRYLYVSSVFSSELRTFEFDSNAGTLVEIGVAQATAPDVTDLAIDPTGRFVSLTNSSDGVIQTFLIDADTGLPSPGPTTATNSIASAMTYSHDGLYAYATSENFSLLIRYIVDQVTGELTTPKTKPTGLTPTFVRIHPCGRFLYVVNKDSDTLTKYVLNESNGIPFPPTIVPTGFSPQSITFDPGGNFAYVTNGNSADLSVYRVNMEDGGLSITENMPARAEPRAMIIGQGPGPVTSEAQFAYVINQESGDIASYRTNPTTGALTEIGIPPLAGDAPVDIASDPLGRYVYVANSGSNDISAFSVDRVTGNLTEVGSPTPCGAGTNSLATESSGRFLYATSGLSGTVSAFRINQDTGALQHLETEATTNPNPVSVRVDPTGRFLYVANAGIDGDIDNPGDVTLFRIDARFGTLTPVANAGIEGGSPSAITFGRSGRIAYVPLSSEQGVVAATVNFATGSLAGQVQAPEAEFLSTSFEVEPTGVYAYSAVEDTSMGLHQIEVFELDSEGNLTTVSSFSDGSDPTDLEVDPSGEFLYAVNPDSNSVSVFSISRLDGSLTLQSTTVTGLDPRSITVIGTVK